MENHAKSGKIGSVNFSTAYFTTNLAIGSFEDDVTVRGMHTFTVGGALSKPWELRKFVL